MDIARPEFARKKRRRTIALIIAGLVLLGLGTLGVMQLKPAAPSVERSTVMIDVVKRGPMLRDVRGLGTLVPTDIRWIPAVMEGRIESVHILPGTKVKASDVILEMSNPQLEQVTLDAEFQLRAAEAEYKNLQAQLQSQVLSQKSETAKSESELSDAKLQAETDQALAKLGVISGNALKVSQNKAENLSVRTNIEQQRLVNSHETMQAQLLAQKAKVDQARALYQLKREQLDSLKVRAGVDGVLQELPCSSAATTGTSCKPGQWMTSGTTLAKVVQPEHLKAELKIPETQTKDIQLGLKAEVDTHNGIIPGHVVRIDPASQGGTVTVDVALDGPLPAGARPDLSVDGRIELELIADTLQVGRPAFGQEKSTVGMFKLEPDGKTAVRVQVKLGRSSVNAVEIVGGLKEGDQVILSDMSRWDNYDRIRLD